MPQIRRAGWLIRAVHRVHRWLGSLLALLLALWFASGAVMTVARYPQYSERERLAQAPVLNGAIALAPEIYAFIAQGGLAGGARLRLSQLEGRATWTFADRAGERRAFRASAPFAVAPLDERRARIEAERRSGHHMRSIERIAAPDQWTVGRSEPGDYPLYRIALADAQGSELYLSARSGEILQQSTRSERLWCWLGAIPHWIYPSALRRDFELWRNSVLVLAGCCLLVTSSGLLSGLHALRARRRARAAGATDAQNIYLRWHQRLGLFFGLFASSWLFSGALSLAPFDWNGPDPEPQQLALIHASPRLSAGAQPLPIERALASCQRTLAVRELEVAAFAGHLLVVCSDANATTRIIDLDDPSLEPRRRLAPEPFRALGSSLAAGSGSQIETHSAPDAYYYATHSEPAIASPFIVVRLHDAAGTRFYLDPNRAALLAHFSRRKRLERWLYHGLHSWDLPGFYDRRWLWRAALWLAMLTGFSLATLGLIIRVRRWRLQRKRSALHQSSKIRDS